MINDQLSYQERLQTQIRVRELQGQWRRVEALSSEELEQLWHASWRAMRDTQSRKPARSPDGRSEDREPSTRSTTT